LRSGRTFTIFAFKTRFEREQVKSSPGKTRRTRRSARRSVTQQETHLDGKRPPRYLPAHAAATFDRITDLPHPLLATAEHSDFNRNFRELQKRAKRPYSLTRVLRSFCKTPPRFDGFEQEVHEELSSLNRARSVVGKLVPIQALSTLKRDLSIAGYPTLVQTTVGDQIIPFLRAKTICGRLGATIIDGLTGGNLRLPRATVGAIASWLPETGGGTDTDQSLDSFTIVPKRISGSTVISRQLVYQSSPDIEDFVANDIANAIGVAVDNAAINGTGTAPQPLGILHYPVNAAGSYTYASRSANVTFGGPATWPNVLAFERILEQGLIVNDGSFGYAVDPTVRDKWQQVAKLTGYPSFLWENSGDDDTSGRVNGRKAISSTQLPAGQVIFGKWSEMLICSWVGVEILVDPYSLRDDRRDPRPSESIGRHPVQISARLLCEFGQRRSVGPHRDREVYARAVFRGRPIRTRHHAWSTALDFESAVFHGHRHEQTSPERRCEPAL
jgi:HK97 family phage major capsid protein